jgi:cytochrome c556
MKSQRRVGLVIAVAAVSVSALALAQNAAAPAKSAAEAKTAIEARQQVFKDIKKAYDPMAAMLKRQREIDPAIIAVSAAQVRDLAGKIPLQYAVDTRQFKDTKTAARDGIWSNPTDFKTKADELAKAAANAAAVGGSGDKAAALKAIAGIGKTCGGCHDSYKDEI